MSSVSPKIGVLPFFLHLYNEVCGEEDLGRIRQFSETICCEYEKRGIEVVRADDCCRGEEFKSAVSAFEQAGVDAIVTLHLAYSPSLESIDAIAATDLPLIILDTTPDFEFGFDQSEEQILYNHGIHGVQDFCNLLLRRGKPFCLEAGHWEKSDVVDRTVDILRGFVAAKAFKNSRVGILGTPFEGMGDFQVSFETLKEQFGINVVSTTSDELAKQMPASDDPAVLAEIDADLPRFEKGEYADEALAASEAAGLAVRRWIEQEKLAAFTMNFGDIAGAPGLPVVPFLEASKAMARGIGYGGEGDVLTAAFCGALMQAAPETTFTEMFCPDWKGDRIFMSHMGEINADLTAGKPVLQQQPYPYSPAGEPVIATGCMQPGRAWLLSLAPGAEETYSLIAAEVEVCDTNGEEKINSGIRGWIRPQMPVSDFLKKYSLAGGTHHKVLCYHAERELFETFAETMNWKFVEIR